MMKHARSLIQHVMEWKKPANDGKLSASQANNAEVEGAVVKKRVKMNWWSLTSKCNSE